MAEKKLTDQIISASIHFAYNFFIYFLLIVPFDLWKKATIRLANQKENGTLNIGKSTSTWPFLSFMKAFILEFLIDGIIFISYPLGFILAIKVGIDIKSAEAIFGALVFAYYYPVILSLFRDFMQLSILPFKKFLSWVSKPAQYMDIEIKNK